MVEIDVTPAATEGNIAAMTNYRVAQFLPSACWIKPQELIENILGVVC